MPDNWITDASAMRIGSISRVLLPVSKNRTPFAAPWFFRVEAAMSRRAARGAMPALQADGAFELRVRWPATGASTAAEWRSPDAGTAIATATRRTRAAVRAATIVRPVCFLVGRTRGRHTGRQHGEASREMDAAAHGAWMGRAALARRLPGAPNAVVPHDRVVPANADSLRTRTGCQRPLARRSVTGDPSVSSCTFAAAPHASRTA